MPKVFSAFLVVLSSFSLGQGLAQSLSITNYSNVDSQRTTGSLWSMTYSADLVNHGVALNSATATLTTSVPNIVVVPGQDVLNFGAVAANGQVTSKNTFTIIVDRSAYFDFNDLTWTFQSVAAPTPPVANAGPNQSVNVGNTVTLNGSASTNPSGVGTLTYSWSFTSKPATSTAVLINPTNVMPTFVADVQGAYVINLTVSNGTGTSSASTTVNAGSVTPPPTPPVANAGPSQTVALGSKVTLDGSKSTDPNGLTLTYSWTIKSVPAGSAATLVGATTVSPTFVADLAGQYVIQLIVSDGALSSIPSTVTIAATGGVAPVANAGYNRVVTTGTLVQLDGSGSTDAGGNPLTYLWSFLSIPTGSVAKLSSTTSVTPTFTVDVAGTYVIQLVVNNGSLNSTPATVSITTNAVLPPVASAGSNQTVALNALVVLNGSATDPQGYPVTYHWFLLTKPSGSTAVLSNANIASPTFVADVAGTYIAQLIVNNGYINSYPSTVTIKTTDSGVNPPTANAGSNQNVLVGATVTLNGSGSTDPQNYPLTYSWTFTSRPAGSTATLTGATTAAPTFVANLAGSYVVQLIVNNGFLNSSPATVTIVASTTNVNPPVANAGANQNSTVGTTVTLSGSGSTDPQSYPLTYAWTFSSRPSGSAAALNGATTVSPTFVPDLAGTYVVQLIVNDGVLSSSPATVTITVTQTQAPAIVLPTGFVVAPNQTLVYPVTLSSAAGSGGVYVTLTSSDPNTLTVSPATLLFPAGSTSPSSSAKVTGVNYGSASITASATGYSSVSQSVQVGGSVTFYPSALTVNQNAVQGLYLMLSSPAPSSGLTLNLASSNPTVASVPSTVVFDAGTTMASVSVRGLIAGTSVIHASAAPYVADSTATVTVVVQPSVLLPSFVTVGQTVLGDVLSAELPITLSAPAPAGGVTVSLSSSDTSVLVVSPTTVFIAAGATTPSPQPRIVGYIIAYATVTATAPGYLPASLDIQVWDEARLALPPNVTVGVGKSTPFPVMLPGAAPAGGVTITLTSSNPSKVTVTQTVFVPQGANTPPTEPQITGVGSGSASISAMAPGYTSAVQTVYVQ